MIRVFSREKKTNLLNKLQQNNFWHRDVERDINLLGNIRADLISNWIFNKWAEKNAKRKLYRIQCLSIWHSFIWKWMDYRRKITSNFTNETNDWLYDTISNYYQFFFPSYNLASLLFLGPEMMTGIISWGRTNVLNVDCYKYRSLRWIKKNLCHL